MTGTQQKDPRSSLAVRRARAEDGEAVLRLVPSLVAFGPPPWRDRSEMSQTDRRVVREALLASDRNDRIAVFVATLDENVVGFMHVRASIDYYTGREQGHVADLVVADNARGLGVGSRLLAQADAWAREHRFEFLTIAVFERNEEALALYERRGFQREIVRLIKPL